jgi:hypothetical protein
MARQRSSYTWLCHDIKELKAVRKFLRVVCDPRRRRWLDLKCMSIKRLCGSLPASDERTELEVDSG